MCSAISGAPAALVATALIGATGTTRAVSLYLIAGCLVSAACVLLLRERHRAELSDEPVR